MAQNTKNTERELKIQTKSKFFVKYKKREKNTKNSCSGARGGGSRARGEQPTGGLGLGVRAFVRSMLHVKVLVASFFCVTFLEYYAPCWCGRAVRFKHDTITQSACGSFAPTTTALRHGNVMSRANSAYDSARSGGASRSRGAPRLSCRARLDGSRPLITL